MTINTPDSADNWDDDDGDGSHFDEATGLNELPDYPDSSPVDFDEYDDWDIVAESRPESPSDSTDDMVETILVTAESPNGHVTATALMDGRVINVRLNSQATRMTESELADEIVKVCSGARRQAEATQHYIIATIMRELGHDAADTRAFLEHTIGLPSPQTVLDDKAHALAEYRAEKEQEESSAW